MSTSVLEVISFTASEAFTADHSLVDKGLEYLKNAEGSLSVFTGFQVEDPKKAYIFIVWKAYENSLNVPKREDYPAYIASTAHLIAGDWSLQHVELDLDPTAALSAPVTEISKVTPKEGFTQSDVDAIIVQLREHADVIPGAHAPLPWGKIIQAPETYTLAVGWDTVQAHQNAVQVPPIDKLAGRLFQISDLVVSHVALHRI
ncbi:hypothetical protein JR316_0010066 [Psilocybe cubensis]|uniref:Uncharacterized protein n=2 Tax=Psilocybe cubensis TaxID=181762 RepID=A0ACB8GQH6_PSICU|nr:hypothetical protein JR316_0010066 [Psilocybe cubensis]KAH9477834.1 hypothetical protein JR316_0010066 [Psilocybe cubensis]